MPKSWDGNKNSTGKCEALCSFVFSDLKAASKFQTHWKFRAAHAVLSTLSTITNVVRNINTEYSDNIICTFRHSLSTGML